MNIKIEPGQSTSCPFEELVSPRKKSRVSRISDSDKVMINNVFQYVKKSWPVDKYPYGEEMKEKTAKILGISKSAVYRHLKEDNKRKTTVKPQLQPPKKRLKLIEKIDGFDESRIRRIVHSFYFKGELPTSKKVLHAINADDSLPNMASTSLKTILKHLKFKFIRRWKNTGIIDRNDIALWRIRYLKNIKKYREQERPIYYLDETWVNAGYTIGKMGNDPDLHSEKNIFWESFMTGVENPTLKGNGLMILHIGGDQGFVPKSALVFECNSTGNYHKLMNATKFENWFQALLQRLEPNAVVVMDNVSYHSRRREKIPVINWNKQDIQEWLSSKQIIFEPNDTKVELLEKVKTVKSHYQSYVVDEMAKEVGVCVLRLPPYHCELNPIELVWTDVKGYVARNNTTFEIEDVKNLLQEALHNITAEKWQNYISHVKKQESKLDGLDNNIDNIIDSLTINVTAETSSEYSDSDITESASDSELI